MSRKLSSRERYWQRKREEKAQYERTLRLLRERLDARRAEKTDD